MPAPSASRATAPRRSPAATSPSSTRRRTGASALPELALRTAATEGKFEAEGWRLRKDGSRFWAHVVIDPIRGTNGELLGYAKITRDLTERRVASRRW